MRGMELVQRISVMFAITESNVEVVNLCEMRVNRVTC